MMSIFNPNNDTKPVRSFRTGKFILSVEKVGKYHKIVTSRDIGEWEVYELYRKCKIMGLYFWCLEKDSRFKSDLISRAIIYEADYEYLKNNGPIQ